MRQAFSAIVRYGYIEALRFQLLTEYSLVDLGNLYKSALTHLLQRALNSRSFCMKDAEIQI
jgi:hypothetical protein